MLFVLDAITEFPGETLCPIISGLKWVRGVSAHYDVQVKMALARYQAPFQRIVASGCGAVRLECYRAG